MSLLKVLFAAVASIVNTITLNAPFGTSTGAAGPTTITSVSRTVTVPIGNSGKMIISPVAIIGSAVCQYSRNGGLGVALFAGTPVTVSFGNGDSLQFRILAPAPSGDVWTITLDDFDSGNFIDTWRATIT